ncbi:aldo/keto reductase [Pararobbsia silviterrae]|uniref:Aldo/keto reductase n=1 Tax=Pararobbsia silviterrae TaxID=1792498 RepID=A0A494X695_9BURK|nr:aldo/keto reductase [Pararobbsia silviterrae]RKP46178.1 aldo/keto reductase [Pararobbsia silviterrae]
MKITDLRPLGRTGASIPVLGVGTCPLGELFGVIPDDEATATLNTAWHSGIRLYDTSPWYGLGLGERRTGSLLYRKPLSSYVLSTKVGRLLRAPERRDRIRPAPWKGGLAFDHVYDYSYGGIMRSYEDSLQRLGVNRVDVLYIHDLDTGYFKEEAALLAHLRDLEKGGFRALEELKQAGDILAYGAGINEPGMIHRFLDRHPLDVFLVASRYTLLEQQIYADELLRAAREGASIVVGGVFNSGILATGAREGARFEYGAAPPAIVERVRRLERVAQRHDVALAAAALQFPFGFSAVSSVLFGPTTAEEIEANVHHFERAIPPQFWADLRDEGLVAEDVPLPAAVAV